jgi:hypothetical protein
MTTDHTPGTGAGETFRVLVTGSRTWTSQTVIHAALDQLPERHGAGLRVVHGQAAAWLRVRVSDIDHLITAGWLEPVAWTHTRWQRRRSAPAVPLFHDGLAVLHHPPIDWDAVRAVPTGRPSPRAALTTTRPTSPTSRNGDPAAGRASGGEQAPEGPRRVRRERTPGWRTPTDRDGRSALYVGRPSRWGNPHRVDAGLDPATSVTAFRDDLLAGRLPVTITDVRHHLAGRDLTCWCRLDQPCHADVLLAVANHPPNAGEETGPGRQGPSR